VALGSLSEAATVFGPELVGKGLDGDRILIRRNARHSARCRTALWGLFANARPYALMFVDETSA